jgi:hypothetical protein
MHNSLDGCFVEGSMGNAGEGGIAVAEGWWERNFKNHLAGLVFICSFFGLLLTAFWSLAQVTGPGREVFNVPAPLFGTWVGTILTFYFTRENFKEANEAVNRIVDRLTPEQRPAQTPVRQAMKPRGLDQGPPAQGGRGRKGNSGRRSDSACRRRLLAGSDLYAARYDQIRDP